MTGEMSMNFKEPIFAFVKKPIHGHTKPLTDLVYCRESFCEYLRQDLRNVRHYGIDTNKLHMVVYRKIQNQKAFQNQVMAAQTMLNVIEKHYGWPLTRVYPVEIVQKAAKGSAFYYVSASKRWMKAPAMLSLFTLLFRIATNETKFKFKHRIRSLKSLFAVLDELYVKSTIAEIMYYGEHGHNWKLVLDNYKKLFGGREMRDLYFPKVGGYFFTEGINELCDISSKDPKLNRIFRGLVKKKESK